MQQFTQGTERRLVVGFFVLLLLLGGALIWIFYGHNAAILGVLCMLGGLLFFTVLYAIVWGLVWLVGKWAGEG